MKIYVLYDIDILARRITCALYKQFTVLGPLGHSCASLDGQGIETVSEIIKMLVTVVHGFPHKEGKV